ncbi:MAG TPA: hypothetical protein VFP72_22270 [Kineosporiaceae bacterium]|nr:hypothetical protein [Kineosporiaceae bacterium]
MPGAVPAPAGYGSTVDEPAPAPAPFLPPGTLPVRPEGRAVTATGNFRAPFPGSVGARWLLTGRGDEVTLTGQGYVQVRWAATYARGTGPLQLPVWSGLQGKLFHVASGGGHRLDDGVPGATDLPHTWLGNPSTGYDTLPPGAAPPWHVEYYYLDGSVTLTNLEDAAGYDLGVGPRTRAQVLTDLNTAPGRSVVRFGLVRDNGTDTAPVPQYLTRSTIGTVEGLLAVPQHSAV